MKKLFFSIAMPFLLTACGSGGGDSAIGGGGNGGVAGSMPAADTFVAQVQAVVASSEDSDPLVIDALLATAPEDSDPIAI